MTAAPPASGPRILTAIQALDVKLTSIDRLLARLAAPDTTSNPDLTFRLNAMEQAIRELTASIEARRTQADTHQTAFETALEAELVAAQTKRQEIHESVEQVKFTADKLDGDVVRELKKMRDDLKELRRTVEGTLALAAADTSLLERERNGHG
jgi:chromosome segregation ATPase